MSLDWDTTKCDPPLPTDKEDARFRDSLIWSTLGLDLGSITDQNLDEWVWRLWHQRTAGLDFFHIPESADPVQLRSWIGRWVGMVCNVQSKPRQAWLKRVAKIMATRTTEDIKYRISAKDSQPAESSATFGGVADVPEVPVVGAVSGKTRD